MRQAGNVNDTDGTNVKIVTVDGQDYRLPNSLNAFQQAMYVHLINWKWQHITREPGLERGVPYDAILPDSCADQYLMLYPTVIYALELAGQAGLNLRGAALVRTVFEEAIGKGMGEAYFPVIARLVDPSGAPG